MSRLVRGVAFLFLTCSAIVNWMTQSRGEPQPVVHSSRADIAPRQAVNSLMVQISANGFSTGSHVSVQRRYAVRTGIAGAGLAGVGCVATGLCETARVATSQFVAVQGACCLAGFASAAIVYSLSGVNPGASPAAQVAATTVQQEVTGAYMAQQEQALIVWAIRMGLLPPTGGAPGYWKGP